VRVIEPPSTRLVTSIEPIGADHNKHHIAGGDLFFNDLHEVEPGSDVVYVHEELVWLVALPQPIQQPSSSVSAVISSVAKKDTACHAHPQPTKQLLDRKGIRRPTQRQVAACAP